MLTLSKALLSVLMIGSTHYIDVGKDTDAAIYYPSEQVAHMALPNGPVWKGSLELKADGYFVNWANGPEGNWQIQYKPGQFTYIGPDGKAAGTITRIVPGNPEKF